MFNYPTSHPKLKLVTNLMYKAHLLSLAIWFKTYWKELIFLLFALIFMAYIAGCHLGGLSYQHISNINKEKVESICQTAELFSYILGILAIALAFSTLRKYQSIFEAQVIFKYDKDYASKEMCAALRTLHDFMCKENNIHFFSKHRESSYNPRMGSIFVPDDNFRWPIEVDNARRDIKMYFLNPYNMYMQGKISRSVFRCIVDKYGLPLLFDIVEKLEYLNNPDYENEKFYHIMLLAGDIYEKHRRKTSRYYSSNYITRYSRKETLACKILRKLLKCCEENNN